MLKLMLTVCLFTFAAYLPANEQEEISSQDIFQEALSCRSSPKNDEPKDAVEDALACRKHKKNKAKDESENALACRNNPKSDADKADATEESSLLALFCPNCTEIEPDFLACKGKK